MRTRKDISPPDLQPGRPRDSDTPEIIKENGGGVSTRRQLMEKLRSEKMRSNKIQEALGGGGAVKRRRQEEEEAGRNLAGVSHTSGDTDAAVPDILIDRSTTTSGQKIYRRGELLGKGAFATVYLITDQISGGKFAVKTISKELLAGRKKMKEKIDLEIRLHQLLSNQAHKNIIKFIKSFETSSFVFLVLELAQLKTLKEVSTRRVTVAEAEARYYFTQIAAGMKFLWENKILHRDIKLSNLFLSADLTVKIGDFGLAIPFDDNRKTSLCGTPNFISPEVLNGQGHSVESELWSVGCVVYALLCGNPPFHSQSKQKTFLLIKSHSFKIPPELSLQAAQFIMQLLDMDPLNRGNLNPAGAAHSLLGHPFLSEGFTPLRLPPSAVFQEPNWDQIRRESRWAGSARSAEAVNHRKFLERVDLQLQLFLRRKGQVLEGKQLVDRKKVPVFISRWVEYEKSYGFVFQLSDGGLGVLYKDDTNFGVSADGKRVQFTDLEGKDICGVPDSSDRNNNGKLQRDLQDRFEILKKYVRFMLKNLEETVLNENTFPRVRTGKPSKLPQMVRRLRTEDCIVMQLSCNQIQVNFSESHQKAIIWEGEDGEMFATVIFTVGTETRAQTWSLVRDSSGEMSAEMRGLLSKTRGRIRAFIQ